jgi:prophage regulatory protein
MRINQGMWPKAISLGARAVGWRETEIVAMNAARIAGKPDDELRKLVVKLEADRKHAA